MSCNNEGSQVLNPHIESPKTKKVAILEDTHPLEEIKIGSQIWSAENLSVISFRNGDPILQVKTNEDWLKCQNNATPAWCYYNNDSSNKNKYGKLYNWFAVSDSRGLAPSGWQIPQSAEWLILLDYLGGQDDAGRKLKAISGWEKDGNGTNISGFGCMPGGRRSKDGLGEFYSYGSTGQWWSSTESTSTTSWALLLIAETHGAIMLSCNKPDGLSVRCIRRE